LVEIRKKIPTIIDERGCNLTSKPTIIDWRGENPSKIVNIDYCEMCKIHEAVGKKQLLGIYNLVPAVGTVVPAVPAEVVS